MVNGEFRISNFEFRISNFGVSTRFRCAKASTHRTGHGFAVSRHGFAHRNRVQTRFRPRVRCRIAKSCPEVRFRSRDDLVRDETVCMTRFRSRNDFVIAKPCPGHDFGGGTDSSHRIRLFACLGTVPVSRSISASKPCPRHGFVATRDDFVGGDGT